MVSMNPVLDLPLRGPVRKMTPDLLFQRGSRLGGQPYRGRDGHQHRLAIRHGPVQSSLQTSNKPERHPVEPQARLRVSAPVAYSLDSDDFDRNAPRPWGRTCSLSLTTTVYSSMWASRSCGSLDNHPPLSYIRAPEVPPTWLNGTTRLCISQAGKQSRANLAYKRGGSMRVLRPS